MPQRVCATLALACLPLVFDMGGADPVVPAKLACLLTSAGIALCLPGIAWSRFWRDPMLIALVAWVGWCWLGGVLAGPMAGSIFLVVLLSSLVFLRADLANRQLDWCRNCLLFAWFSTAAYSWLQRLGLDPFAWSNPELSRLRTIAGLGNPNYLSMYLAALLPYVWSRIYSRGPGPGWIFVWLGWVTLLLSSTRGAILSLSMILVVSSLWAGVRRTTHRRFWLVTWFLFLAGWVCSWGLAETRLQHSTSMTAQFRSLSTGQDLSLKTRTLLWGSAFEQGLRHPILGLGVGHFGEAYLRDRPLEPEPLRPLQRSPEDPHSEPLRVWCETGVVGFGLWAFWLLSLLWRLFRCCRVDCCCLAVLLVNSLSNSIPMAIWPLLMLWTQLGLGKKSQGKALAWPLALPALLLCCALALSTLLQQRVFWWDDEYQIVGASQKRVPLLRESKVWCPPWFWTEHARRTSLAWAAVAQRDGDWEQAIEASRLQLRLDPENAYAWRSLATILQQSGRLEEASQAWSETHKRDPGNPAVPFLWAKCLAKQGKLDDALRLTQQSIEIYSKIGQVYQLRGQIMIDQGRTWEGYWDWIRGYRAP